MAELLHDDARGLEILQLDVGADDFPGAESLRNHGRCPVTTAKVQDSRAVERDAPAPDHLANEGERHRVLEANEGILPTGFRQDLDDPERESARKLLVVMPMLDRDNVL